MLPQAAHTLIPQRVPFIMVDNLLHATDTGARCNFIIDAGNPLVDKGILTEGGLLENIAQTAAAHAGYKAQAENKPVAPGFIGSVKDFEVFALPNVGEELLTDIEIEDHVFDVTVITGKIWRNGELIASCEMKIFIQNIAGKD